MKFTLSVLAVLVGPLLSTSFAQELSMNDVSILLPLPEDLKTDLLPKPRTAGSFGELLPLAYYQELPLLAMEDRELTWERLRVVAIRLDPCFPSNETPVKCLTQIRLIWQPLEMVFRQGVFAQDAAIHTFYSIPLDDFKGLMKDLKGLKKALKVSNDLGPLTVHPVLAKEGLKGKFGQKLIVRILQSIGQDRLTRFTFTGVAAGGNIWIFGGLDVTKQGLKEIRIPRLGTKVRQGFFNNLGTPESFSASGISPAPTGPDQLNLLVSDSSQLTKADEPQILEGALSATRIENPNFHNPHTVDCASCHVAQAGRMFADRRFPHLKLEERTEPFRFKSNFDLTNTSPNQTNTNRVRAFGYEGNLPAISQRVINETAVVLESLQAAAKE